ncbi:hypothetical protein [Modestobacter excelsi]|uniref:hypothetical protein n=1 Tax=Modestobacter excelsi TaxID=2213161 RepID=UPI00110C997C|nr:hypothetical protein [Modestobacter excelsi]
MTTAELATFLVTLGLAALLAYLVFWVVPSFAVNRMIIELSEVRTILRDLEEREPGLMVNTEVQLFDDLLGRVIAHGRSLGVTYLVGAVLQARHDHAHGKSMAKDGFDAGGSLNNLSPSQQVAFRLLAARAFREFYRATFMASRCWFVFWPVWLLMSRALHRLEEHPLTPLSAESQGIEQAVWRGFALDSGVLQPS